MKKNKNGVDTTLSVDAYQSKYTSEDNDSFNEIIAKNNEIKKARNEKLYGQEKTKLLMSSNSQNASDVGKSVETKQIETWKYKVNIYIYIYIIIEYKTKLIKIINFILFLLYHILYCKSNL